MSSSALQVVLESLGASSCILTKGTFDILHRGHLSLFSYLQALKKQYNAQLVVGVASDNEVRGRKRIAAARREVGCALPVALPEHSELAGAQVDVVQI